MEGAGQGDTARGVRYPDLDAEVWPDTLPDGLAGVLERAYGHFASSLDYLTRFADLPPRGCCLVGTPPRQALVFALQGRTVRVLNEAFTIPPDDARRACLALLRAFPRAARVRLEVRFPAADLGLPLRPLAPTYTMVVPLGEGVEAYETRLGRRTRHNLRYSERRLRRAAGEVSVATVPAGPAAQALVPTLVEWKLARFRARGRTTYWERRPDLVDALVDLVGRRGEVLVTSADGRPVALRFLFPYAGAVCSLESGFDPAWAEFRLGSLTLYWAVRAAAAAGAREFQLLWGTPEYKEHLGAERVPATHVSVYRSRAALLARGLDEAATLAWRRARDVNAHWWRARHAARRLAALLTGGRLPARGDDGTTAGGDGHGRR